MQVQITPASKVKTEAKVLLTVEEVNSCFDTALSKCAKSARIDGFRKGRIPKPVLLQVYGRQIAMDAAEEAVNKFSKEALQQVGESGVDVIDSTPELAFNDGSLSRGKEWSYTLTVDNYPAIEKKDLSGVSVELYSINTDDKAVEEALDALREERGTYQVVDDLVIAKGENQKAVINFTGTKDGVAFDKGSAKDYELYIDRSRMIPGFIDALVGHKAGDDFSFDVTFPENYQVEELKGAQAKFDVQIVSVAQLQKAELNDDFIKSLGFDPEKGQTLEDLKNSLSNNLKTQYANCQTDLNVDIMQRAICKEYGDDIEVPEVLVDAETRSAFSSLFRVPANSKLFESDRLKSIIDEIRESLRPNLKIHCLIHGLIQANGLVDSMKEQEGELEAELKRSACAYEEGDDVDFEEFKKKALEDEATVQECRTRIYLAKLEKALRGLLTVTEKQISFKEYAEISHKLKEEKAAEAKAAEAKAAEAKAAEAPAAN